MKSVNDIRSAFLGYFKSAGHEVVPSASLVPHNDPTLMFTNAGMVPFKNVFTGAEQRSYTRAVSSQKCVRAGGKHNDLDNVGYTARHHTFFEMLGNFSFGDYFKEEAISLAWLLVHKEYGLSKDRLTVTVYHEDNEAFDLWRKIAGLPEERIIRIATSDNFWSMGDTGPCGPCSEIFYDHGDHIAGGPPGSPDEDGDRFVEIWNLVFMQFDQMTKDKRVDLPKPCIDTGMGLERIAAVMQGTHDNYDIDLMRALIEASADASHVSADGDHKVSHRVIADHLRASSFLIADGVLPSNEGRGYVLRRIMRRAMRHAHIIGAKDPLMHQLVPALTGKMGAAYPELMRAEALIAETLKLEEVRFRQTLERGLGLLEDELEKLPSGKGLPGEIAFKLYDTYGFPLDLTQDALRARGLSVDIDGFNQAMARQKAEARAAWAGSGDVATETVWFEIKEKEGATEFVGYTSSAAEGRIVALIRDGEQVKSASKGDSVAIVTNQTPFYGESGGQMGDTGRLGTAGGASVRITNTQKKLGALHIHMGVVDAGDLRVGDIAELEIDTERRDRMRANHSATHLLHEALRRTLGSHVSQKGSLVAEDRLRFDISHPRPITAEEIDTVEAEVNRLIRENREVTTRIMAPDEAVEAGALALFGEKYGDEVRVISMGPGDAVKENGIFSVELCGGTHVNRMGDIALFKIVGESAVSSGVRRIEALTGEAARNYLEQEEDYLLQSAGLLKTTAAEVPARIAAILEERKSLERELSEARKKLAMGGGGGSSAGPEPRDIGGIAVLTQKLDDFPARDLRGLIEAAKTRLGSGVVAIVTVNEGKAALAVGVTEDLTPKVSAVDLVRHAASVLGGSGGGGRPDMAQAGGPDGSKADEALGALEEMMANLADAG